MISPTDAIEAFGWFIVFYFAVVNLGYLAIHLVSFKGLASELRRRRWSNVYTPVSSPFLPAVSVVVPAYNEEEVITNSVRSLLDVEYQSVRVVVVNDGSTDATLDRLVETFDLRRVDAEIPFSMPSEKVHGVYESPEIELTVIDKDNGGKSDALNAGVAYIDTPLFCAVDADSIIERGALLEVVKPFLRYPERTVVAGGAVRVANGCDIEGSLIRKVVLSPSRLVRVQTMEYIRAFLSGRVGLSSLNSLLIVSGAFGVFRTDVVREVGGYSTETVTEDMEIVVRIHRHLADQGTEYRMEFVPQPVVWTRVPESVGALGRQRRRWYRGLLQTLSMHRAAVGRPRYGTVGMFALPFFLVVEAIGPLVEGAGYLVVPAAFLLGVLEVDFFLLFLAVAVGFGALLSWLSVLEEVVGFRRYEKPSDIVVLLVYGILEHVVYRQWKTVVSWRGFFEFVRKEEKWGEMERKGFEGE